MDVLLFQSQMVTEMGEWENFTVTMCTRNIFHCRIGILLFGLYPSSTEVPRHDLHIVAKHISVLLSRFQDITRFFEEEKKMRTV